jgi:hypothetical protein
MRIVGQIASVFAAAVLTIVAAGCGDDAAPADRRSAEQLLGALLTVDDVAFIPGLPEDFDDDPKWVEAPAAPWDGTLDPVLCSEAGTPSALTLPQAQTELAGINLMEVLLSSSDAGKLFDELAAAYTACDTDSSLPYAALADAPAIGDESESYRCELGLATIARFGNDVLILRWMVQADTDLAIPYYPEMLNTIAAKITALNT